MKYRREIDGLRAVAVVPVILFHSGIPGLPGGFVGVDVFFVLSGYLITTLLIQDLAVGRYSIVAFYERRARRILPALFVVMAVSMPLAFVTMLPSQIEDFSASLAASVVFLSNFFFLSQVGYFSPDADLQPLLHIWSLSVEEQFYLLFPPALALLWRRGLRRVVSVLALIAIASLIFSHWAGSENPARNFFFTGSRIWELLAGALTAILLYHRALGGSDLFASAGLAMIVAAMLGLGAAAPFPGLWTLVPVLGTVLVILFARTGTLVARLLSWPGFVGVGLISYSAYLWHKPLFAFARLHWVAEPPAPVMLGLAGLALLLAWATWAWVEQPFRRRPLPLLPTRNQLFASAAIAGIVFLAFGLLGKVTGGLRDVWMAAWPHKAEIMAVIERAQSTATLRDDGACRFNLEEVNEGSALRIRSCVTEHGPGLAVLGDSHAIDLFGIVTAREDRPFVVGFTKPACRPATVDQPCPYASFLTLIKGDPSVFSLVLFEMSGAHLLTGDDGRPGVQTSIERLPLTARVPSLLIGDSQIATVNAFLAEVAEILPVVWVGPRTEPQVQLEWLVGRGCEAGLMIRDGTEENFERLDAVLARDSEVPYLSQNRLFRLEFPRDLGGCGGLIWSDGDHFSVFGEAKMAQRADIVAAAESILQ